MNNRLKRLLGVVALCVVAACSSNTSDTNETSQGQSALVASSTTLNTFINDSLEVDQVTPGGLQPQDANLFVGNDPADGTSSTQAPPGGPGAWIDWNDLGGDLTNHRLLDEDLASGKDPTSFPQSNECVNSSQVLSKMDLRYVAAANNNKYAYFGVLRANNNGDAGYYWLFTKKAPSQTAGEAPCSSGQKRLKYDISVGDVLLAGHFKPNGSPLLRVFKANSSELGVTAVAAVDFTNARWTENATALAAVAVNTTPTAPGAFGTAGVIAQTNGKLDPEVFAEAAVDLALFTGGASNCGAQYHGSVITRSSGSGGTSPDLKDLAGPAVFNFGSAKATATLTGGCASALGYGVVATGADGTPLQNPTCTWTFDNGAQASTACAGTLSVAPGVHSGAVTVTDPVSGCSAASDAASVSVFAPLGVSLSRTSGGGSCPGLATYAVTYQTVVTGGTGATSVSWSGATCSGPSCTVDPQDGQFCAAVNLQATVTDDAGLCPPATSEVETYTKVTTVTATDN